MRRSIPALLACFLPAALALAAEPAVTVVAVRHAEKVTDQGRDPHLTTAGEARAGALAQLLAAAPVGGLYASEYLRTQETLAPLADASGVEVVTVGAAQTEQRLTAEWLLDRHQGQVVVVAGHSNTIPALVAALTGQEVAEIDDGTYDDLFVVTLDRDGGTHLLHLKYGESSAPAEPER